MGDQQTRRTSSRRFTQRTQERHGGSTVEESSCPVLIFREFLRPCKSEMPKSRSTCVITTRLDRVIGIDALDSRGPRRHL